MSEQLKGHAPSKIDIENEAELRWWSKELGATEDKIRGAVTRVGDSPDAVRRFLEQSASPRQEVSE